MAQSESSVSLDYSKPGHPAKKYVCPSCRKKRFVRYIDTNTNNLFPEQYGRCDREDSCGYFMHPSEDGLITKEHLRAKQAEQDYEVTAIENDFAVVDRKILISSLASYESNNLFKWFEDKFGYQVAFDTFWLFYVGTAKDGSAIFWQVDERLNPRTAKKAQYVGFSRDKAHLPYYLYQTTENYKSCLFGLHQLNGIAEKDDYRICIVESEKTAMICSIFIPTLPFQGQEKKIIWLSSCACDGLTMEKVRVLKGWKVILWPDFSWLSRAKWGLVPYRKKEVNDPEFINPKTLQRGRVNRVPAADGDIVADYESAIDRIESAGADYCKGFDYAPDILDGSDIADILKEWDYELPENQYKIINYKKPNFENYRITEHRSETLEPNGDYTSSQTLIIEFDPDAARAKVLANKSVLELMTRFNLVIEDIKQI